MSADQNGIHPTEVWASGDVYETYMGRWSRLVADDFLAWLSVTPGNRWLDVGCGTGALCQTILRLAAPNHVKGVDPSDGYIAHAKEHVQDERAFFEVADAMALPDETASFDAVVSGLALNFIPQPDRAVDEMVRVVKPDGIVAAYVWDYSGRMELMRYFWDAAVALDPNAANLDEGRRFPLCQPRPLTELFQHAGLMDVAVRAIDVATVFIDFDDYWLRFLGGQAPAPRYAMSLSEENRAALRERIRAGLPVALDGSIPLVARAWAVRGVRQ